MDYNQERLAKIEATQERILTLLEGMAKRLEDKEEDDKETRRLLQGSNGSPGILVRLDRVEQSQERTRWVTRAILGAVVTLIVGGFYAILTG